ncbi:g10322 [Coccomyxa elongata]
MAFVMSLARTKRVKYIGQDGTEVYQEDNRWHFLDAENLASQEATVVEDTEDGEPGSRAKPLTPREVLEKIYAARGEVDVILDLVNAVEEGQHLNVANVPPPKNTLHGLTNQRALQVHAKQSQLEDAGERLRRGAGLLAASLDRDDAYYNQAAQLQCSWKLKSSPAGTPAPLMVDISLPFAPRGKREPSIQLLLLDRLPSGSVCVSEEGFAAGGVSRQNRDDKTSSVGSAADEAQAPDSSGADVMGPSGEAAVEAVDRALQRLQRGVLWDAVQRLLEAEAAEADAGGSGHVLAAQLVHRAMQGCPPAVATAALGPLLLCRYLKAVDERGAGVLADVCAWVRFLAFLAHVRASLERQAARLPGFSLRWLPVCGLTRAAVQIHSGSRPPALLLISGETLLLEGDVGNGAASLGYKCGSCRHTRVSRQDFDSLLQRIQLQNV